MSLIAQLRSGEEPEDVGAGILEVLGDRGELLGQGVDDSVERGLPRWRRAGHRSSAASS
jgi:hypothetical protein